MNIFTASFYASRSVSRLWKASLGMVPEKSPSCDSFGGHEFFDTESGIERTPTIFVHGSFSTPNGWSDVIDGLIESGWNGDELWAICFNRDQPTHPQMAAQIDTFVTEVKEKTGSSSVNIVAHSLGVTGARYWIDAYNEYNSVDVFVGLAGANHGIPAAHLPNPGGDVKTFLTPESKPLQRLNESTTKHEDDIEWYTIRGVYDEYFYLSPCSPKLSEAKNVLLFVDHLGVRDSHKTLQFLTQWLDNKT